MATDKIEIRTGTKDATLWGRSAHKVSAPRAGPTPYKYYTYMGPKTKKADFRPARVLALVPFFFLMSYSSPSFPPVPPPLASPTPTWAKTPNQGGEEEKQN